MQLQLEDDGHCGRPGELQKQNAPAPSVRAEDVAATVYALTSDTVYLRLTRGYGWSPSRYAEWLGDLLVAALLDSGD